ncbi:MAG: hypothetical protein DRN06_01490 [Thermoprotei archaeon]|nr:MAG: hypothetical protein DRN06_01490 [Thermoprotei archaeon]
MRANLRSLKNPIMVIGFSGYTDAAGVASFSIDYLIKKTGAKKLTSLKRGLYVLSTSRPITVIRTGLVEEVKYPCTELYVSKKAGLLALRGEEPNINWEDYVEEVMEIIEEANVSSLYTLGGLIDYVEESKVSAVVSSPELKEEARVVGAELINYEGPCSIYTVIIRRCGERGVKAMSLWGHVPFQRYSTLTQLRSPDLKTAYLTLKTLCKLTGIDLELERLRAEAETMLELVDRIRKTSEEKPSKFFNYIY